MCKHKPVANNRQYEGYNTTVMGRLFDDMMRFFTGKEKIRVE